MAETLIELEDLSLRFPGGVQAVDRLSLSVVHGEILALMGPSGSGKTTVLRLIAGLERPDSGRLAIRDHVVAGPGVWVEPERRGVGLVFQDYALFPHLTVEENVGFGLHARRRDARRRRVDEVLDLVGLAGIARRPPHELSGGQQQRVALARALAPAPDVILLDEPFSNLDADLRGQIREEVGRILRYTSTTAIFVTHDQEEGFAIADRVGVLHAGRLEQVDSPERVYHAPATRFVARFVGAAAFIPGTVSGPGIRTELGDLPNAPGLPRGAAVEVMIRPDDIDFALDPHGEAVIVARQFRGPENLYRLRMPSGATVHSVKPSTSVYTTGQRVRVSTRILHVVAYPSSEGRSVPPSELSPGVGLL
jgi:iron(III) transport system ATP-binding protein